MERERERESKPAVGSLSLPLSPSPSRGPRRGGKKRNAAGSREPRIDAYLKHKKPARPRAFTARYDTYYYYCVVHGTVPGACGKQQVGRRDRLVNLQPLFRMFLRRRRKQRRKEQLAMVLLGWQWGAQQQFSLRVSILLLSPFLEIVLTICSRRLDKYSFDLFTPRARC